MVKGVVSGEGRTVVTVVEYDSPSAATLSGYKHQEDLSIVLSCKVILGRPPPLTPSPKRDAGVCLLDSTCCLGLKIPFHETSEM